jgi:two-component system cell cycle sensor histidine kinase/response regulator CckA
MSAADTTPPPVDPQAKPPRLVLRFALYTAAAFAIAAGATLWVAQRQAVKRAEGQVRFHAEFVAATILRDNLTPRDFTLQAGAMRIEDLDRVIKREVRTEDVLRVKLYDPAGHVTYSDDHSLIGTRPEGDDIEVAMGGKTIQDVSTLNHEGGVGPDKKVLEVYTPVRLGSRSPVGVFELYQDYGPVASSVRHEVYPLGIILLAALVALFAALFPLLRRTTTTLLRSMGEHKRSQERLESAEEQLRQVQKMEAIGQLAGGVAHDFNNLLLAVRGYSDLALQSVGDNPAAREDIHRIQDAADRAGELTRRLLAFSRKQVLQPTVFDLNDAVLDLEPILRRLIGEHIEIETSLDPSGVHVRADASQIQQVLMNLAVNARDAMPDGGTLTIETGRGDAPAGANPGRHAIVRVKDTGHGMDAATRSHVFEPFFTTKEEGKGTGLGLATVYGIVTQSGGVVTLESEPGLGSEFEVYLPAVEGPVTPRRPRSSGHVEGGTETILVTEDDAAVHELLVRILEGRGYRVLGARDADGALRISRAHGGSIDLLVTDVVLPGMSGPKLAAAMRAANPALRVLYISGYAWDTFKKDGVRPGEPFLRKPFSSLELARRVRETLDATPTRPEPDRRRSVVRHG